MVDLVEHWKLDLMDFIINLPLIFSFSLNRPLMSPFSRQVHSIQWIFVPHSTRTLAPNSLETSFLAFAFALR